MAEHQPVSREMLTAGFAGFVQPYPDANRRWKISTRGGLAPVWARTERELLHLDDATMLMAVTVQIAGPQFSAGKPARVVMLDWFEELKRRRPIQ